ncbi:hypothetical protein SAMN04515618_11266 [Collimonas sp. OK307]|uniref:DUF6434 domain-containing protein n=1 Tax=Collimonas sp. OK307 TaxID=1801620 RepID=UPI0008E8734C|nr:DUF6434 domain-containing protein [Collimonas sp. OK307]SFI08171.1 hypothetical protein SAMN04515618_109170 [Collimonas sp. OK307]SFI16962.1 hypothetical protein SAMN04515618_11266 [Collimonas sp. OK307]
MKFDWHGGVISRTTLVDSAYKNTQNVRRFLSHQCGPEFKFDRDLMAWIRNGVEKNMGDVVDEWTRRRTTAQD